MSLATFNYYKHLLYTLIETFKNFILNCKAKLELKLLEEIYDVFLAHFQSVDLDADPTQIVDVRFLPYVNAYLTILFWSTVVFYIYKYGYMVWANAKHGKFLFQVNYAYLLDIEEEFGSFTDYISYIFGLLLLVGWFYIFTLFFHYTLEKQLHTFLLGWALFICITWLFPGTTLVNWGIAFSSYVRGAGKSQLIWAETLLDFIAVSVIFIRFFIQNIRFILISLAYFELFEFMYLEIYFQTNPVFVQTINYTGWKNGAYTNLWFSELALALVWTIILFVYYVAHGTLLFLVQFTIYALLSFWLFSFLFTSFAFTSSEKHFFYKRYKLDAWNYL